MTCECECNAARKATGGGGSGSGRYEGRGLQEFECRIGADDLDSVQQRLRHHVPKPA